MSNELEEKFVSDDGVSTVAEPVTPEGGEVKKKKADVKKKVDPKADTVSNEVKEAEETSEEAVVEEEVINVEESIASIFEGMDLSEDFKSKVTMVFEAAVNEAVNLKTEEVKNSLEEQFETNLSESVNEAVEEIVENLDSYLDYVVREWMEENKVAIESGIKVEMAESLMDGLKDLFESHNIDVSEETIDVVSELEEQIEDLEEKANGAINENIELAKEIASLKAEKVFEEASENLTVSQKERLKVLSEKLDFNDLDSYSENLETLKESFFKQPNKKVISEEAEEEEILTEETDEGKPASQYASVNAVLEAINARTKNK